MKTYTKGTIYTIAILLACQFIFSCSKDVVAPTPAEGTNDKMISHSSYRKAVDDVIVLGKKLQNPYAVENMKKAYANVSAKTDGKVRKDQSPVRSTHYYVRFLPKDWKQYNLLKADTSLKLYDIPLDYEVVLHGNKYKDPSVCSECPTWQYTAVKEGYKFSKETKYEILDNLYLPESDATLARMDVKEKVSGKPFVTALVDEAMVLTQNYSDTIKIRSAGGRRAWDPSGTVRVFDTRLGRLIPLVGVTMRARRWFDIRETSTDGNGNYRLPGFNNPANYALYYETWAFDVRTGTFGQAWIDGPKQDTPWDVDLRDGVDQFYAHVFRGAWRYHFGDIGGLRRPSFSWPNKMKYAAHDKAGDASGVNYGNWSAFGINPNILVYRYSGFNGRQFDSDEVFGITTHETAHSTHLMVMNAGFIQYSAVEPVISESWAIALEWFITQREYREQGIPNYSDENFNAPSTPIHRAYQGWARGVSNSVYTSLFIDIIDGFNQNAVNGGNTPVDDVTGYTFQGIEDGFLKHVYGLHSLSNELKDHKPAGVTDAQIDDLINSY
jgi:hypothetical protein